MSGFDRGRANAKRLLNHYMQMDKEHWDGDNIAEVESIVDGIYDDIERVQKQNNDLVIMLLTVAWYSSHGFEFQRFFPNEYVLMSRGPAFKEKIRIHFGGKVYRSEGGNYFEEPNPYDEDKP